MLVSQEPIKWMDVELSDETFEVLETDADRANVEFELMLPELISQRN